MPSQHGSYQVEEHEAMNGSASLPMGTWLPLLSESSTTARKTIYCDAKVQNVPFVKEFGEGFDRICREQEANGANVPSFRTDEFILKITVPKVAEKVTVNVTEKVIETEKKRAERLTENRHGLIEKHQKLIEKLIEKAARQGDKLTENRISILRLVMDDPYISKADLSKLVGISVAAISANIEVLRGKYLRRVGPDKGGFWEIIE